MSRRMAAAIAGALLACASAQAGAQAGTQAASIPAADATFKAWDTDHDGVLSQAEFRQGWSSARHRAEERKVEASLRAQFDKVDANHDGAIDAGEYGGLLLIQRAGKSAPPLATFDRNGDRRLAFDEYMALVSRLAAAAPRAAQGKAP